MNFKSIGLSAAVATAVTISGAAFLPAQAATLGTSGGFNIKGKATLSSSKPSQPKSFSNPVLNFSTSANKFKLVLADLTGGFAGHLTTANPSQVVDVKKLVLTKGLFQGKSVYSFGETPDFIKGLLLDGTPISFKLFADSLHGTVTNLKMFNLSGSFQGVFTNINNVAVADGTFSLTSGNPNLISIAATPVPTPALLPGLVGLGIAALRKRKSEEIEVETAETAKA